MNYHLEDIVDTGNFVSRERFLSCARPSSVRVPVKKLYFGIDWASKRDNTWAVVGNELNDMADMLKLPNVPYAEQIQLLNDWLRTPRVEVAEDGTEIEYTYEERILAAKGDSTGEGDMPMEILATDTRLPIDSSSHVKFSMQSKDKMYRIVEVAIYKDEGDPLRFSYPADYPLASEFEEQFCALVREYKGEGECLSVHHPDDDPSARDDAPDATALALFARDDGQIGELLVA
ncbi:MAG: hypothetical protein KDB01_02050 [Planctomycetaceae bacterium]|nr:hypothetical protein [Planctomycetaceae bacterium]